MSSGLRLSTRQLMSLIKHPHQLSKKTPQEAWSSKKPTFQHFRVFGCDAYTHVPDKKHTKLDPKRIKCILLGYYEGSKCYRLFNPETKTIVKNRNIKFVEITENKDPKGTNEISSETLEPSITIEVDFNFDNFILESESENEEVVGDAMRDLTIQPLYLFERFDQRHVRYHNLRP